MFASFTKDVRGVDLSYSLISSWDVVSLIAAELPSLERLSLRYVLVTRLYAAYTSRSSPGR